MPDELSFEPDCSYAANFIAANYIISGKTDRPVTVSGISAGSGQADYRIFDHIGNDEIDLTDSPDLFPVLCVASLAKYGCTEISGIKRLRDKESDRIESTASLIRAIGGNIEAGDDYVIIRSHGGSLCGGIVDPYGDHRIVMAASVASLLCREPVYIKNASCVRKSAPQFFDDFRSLGGIADEYIR